MSCYGCTRYRGTCETGSGNMIECRVNTSATTRLVPYSVAENGCREYVEKKYVSYRDEVARPRRTRIAYGSKNVE